MRLTLDEAKKYFVAMKCSKFHMAREDNIKYEEYLNLNINEQTEMSWRSEQFNLLYDAAQSNSEGNSLWKIISRMYDLVSSTKNIDDLKKIHSLIEIYKNTLSPKDRIIIAETIFGRKSISERSGLIFLSYDLQNNKLAKDYVKTANELLNITDLVMDNDLVQRVKNCQQLSCEIASMLNIKV